jgi:pimeloyl-ACP methyl ester carboxylesterase
VTRPLGALTAVLLLLAGCGSDQRPLTERVTHGYADHDGVRIHYVELGSGSPVVLLHGFPDYWYTWHNQMPALAEHHRVVAVDLRGYNLSDKPEGVERYTAELLAGDVAAVIRQLGEQKAVVVGHDWGGMVAWQLATWLPEVVDGLVVMNAPHPQALRRELASNPLQRQRSAYAQQLVKPEGLSFLRSQLEHFLFWAEKGTEREQHLEALKRSDLTAMLNYYRANYPQLPYDPDPAPPTPVTMPVLVIHGLEDNAFAPETLNGSFHWSEAELTLVVLPGVGHWVQHEAADRVTRLLLDWLAH